MLRPKDLRHQPDGDDLDLAEVKDHQPLEGGTHESVAVKANPQHVHTKP